MKKGSCYNQDVNELDLVVSEESEFDLSRNAVYVVRAVVGHNLVQVKNDKGIVDTYTTECFRFYEGERVERRFEPTHTTKRGR